MGMLIYHTALELVKKPTCGDILLMARTGRTLKDLVTILLVLVARPSRRRLPPLASPLGGGLSLSLVAQDKQGVPNIFANSRRLSHSQLGKSSNSTQTKLDPIQYLHQIWAPKV